MWELVKRYWQVFLLKESPANTPCSLFLLSCIAILYWLLLMLQWSIVDVKKSLAIVHPILTSVTVILSYFFYTGLVLKFFKKGSRFLQTATTLLASNFFIHLLAFPLLFMTSTIDVTVAAGGGLFLFLLFYLLFTLILSTWQFLITTHIYKLALDVNIWKAMMVSFGLLACNILTVSLWR